MKAAEMLDNRGFAEFPENRAVKPNSRLFSAFLHKQRLDTLARNSDFRAKIRDFKPNSRDFSTLRDYRGNFARYCVKATEMLNSRCFAELPENRAVKPNPRDFSTPRDYRGNFSRYCVKSAEMLDNRSFAEFPEIRAVKPNPRIFSAFPRKQRLDTLARNSDFRAKIRAVKPNPRLFSAFSAKTAA